MATISCIKGNKMATIKVTKKELGKDISNMDTFKATLSAFKSARADIMLHIAKHLDSCNIFTVSMKTMERILGYSSKTIRQEFKVLEEIDFWYKDPYDSSRYFVNPIFCCKYGSDKRASAFLTMYKDSKRDGYIKVGEKPKSKIMRISELINKANKNIDWNIE